MLEGPFGGEPDCSPAALRPSDASFLAVPHGPEIYLNLSPEHVVEEFRQKW